MNKDETFEGGAKRSEKLPHLFRVYYGLIERTAQALTDGHYRYDPAFLEANWKKAEGDEFWYDAISHLMKHLFLWAAGDRTEDHLGHIGANLQFLIWAEDMDKIDPKLFLEVLEKDALDAEALATLLKDLYKEAEQKVADAVEEPPKVEILPPVEEPPQAPASTWFDRFRALSGKKG